MRILNASLLPENVETKAITPESMGASFELPAVWIGHAAIYAIQLVATGSPVGTFKLQASSDQGGPTNSQNSIVFSDQVVNWTDIADSSQAIAAAGNLMWTVQNPGYQWVKVVYTRTSGTGSLTSARVTTKGV